MTLIALVLLLHYRGVMPMPWWIWILLIIDIVWTVANHFND